MNNNLSQPEIPDRLPPQSIESEQALLGSLFLDEEAIWKIIDFLKPEDFYKASHQKIFQAMIDLASKKEPIDLKTLANRLKEINSLEEIGGYAYLTELINSVPTPSNILAYAKTIQKKRILRNLISASHEIARLGYSEEQELEKVLDQAEKTIFNITQKGSSQRFFPLKSTLEPAYDRISKIADFKGRILGGLATGFPELDNILAGFQKSDLIVLASRPGYGKSSLALNIAYHVARQEKQAVGIFSLEMSREQIAERLIASQSKIDLWRLRTGRLSKDKSPNDFDAIREALDVLSQIPIFIDDTSSPTVLQMKAMARRLQAEYSLGLVIVDYLQLVQPLNPKESEVQQITRISRALKDLARELNVPVLAVSQLSRAVEKRFPPIPKLADLRASGSIEQDADIVMFINRLDKYNPTAKTGATEIIIAKHRNGPTGKINLQFNQPLVTFVSVDTTQKEPEPIEEELTIEEPE
jgi:replicative DNA helicase